MSGPPDHEREPDRAALDELEQAFGGPTSASDADADADADGDGSTQPVGHAGPVTGELLIVEAEPFQSADPTPDDLTDDPADDPADDPVEAVIEPAGVPAPKPTIIRIDDYSGSHQIEDPRDETPIGDPSGLNAEVADGEPIVIEIDDELPDAVYIEGSLDRSGSRSIVIIEDDDTGDALVPESERDIRRGIEPRMRERRVAVKRAQGRKRLKWVMLAALVVVVVVGALALLGSGLFAVKERPGFRDRQRVHRSGTTTGRDR